MENKIVYTEAIEELESIVNEIENEDITVDELSEKVKRASILIKLCKEKLNRTEDEINEVLKEIKSTTKDVQFFDNDKG